MKKAILVSFVVILGTAVALQAEFKVNTYTTDDQEFPAIAMGAQGDFVVVWRSAKQDAGSRGTYGQRFDADGTPIGGEFKINTTSVGGRVSTGPSVALDSSGNFVVAWTGYRDNEENIIARRYNAGGSPITGEFIVNTQTHSAYENSHIGPTVAMNASGAFVIVWEAWHGDSSGHGKWCVYGRAYDSNGVPRADEFMVTQLPHGHIPDVAMDESGDFVVAWRRSGDSDDLPLGSYIRFRRYNADGTPKGNAIQITDELKVGVHHGPSIAMDGDGDFVIAWPVGPWPYDIYAQLFDANGVPIDEPFLVNTHTDDSQGLPSVGMDEQGEFVIVWSSGGQDGSSYGVFGQRYNSDGMPVDEEFQLNTYTLDNQWYPDIALSESGRFVVVWQSNGQDGSGEGIFAEFGQLPRQLTYYVDADAMGANNGSSWTDAFNELQDALAVVLTGDEIRVAEGVYKPIAYMPPPPPPPPPFGSSNEDESIEPAADRTATFQLKNGVVIKGGHAGFGEPVPNERDPNKYETVLSGDIGIAGFEGDNSYHVVTGSGCDKTTVLDGFTITAGNANGVDPDNNGAGMINYSGSPTLTDCTFSGNSAGGDGGGMFNWDSSPTLTSCTFWGNSAHKGGGMHNRQYSDPRVTNCTFIANSAGGEGGGMRNKESGPTVTNCTFSGNSSGFNGGGIQNALNSSSLLVNCLFSGNWAERAGGGLSNFSTSSTTVTKCTFIGNSAGEVGGGMHNNSSSNPTVTNCTFSGNLASDNGGGMYNQASSPTLTNCTFSGNSTMKAGGGMHNNESNPTLTNCSFTENSAARAGGMRNRINSSPTLINCTFIGNLASENGGGMGNRNIGRPTLINCTFSGNRAEIQGGGVFNDSSSISTLANCILWGNTAPIGPQIDNDGTSWAIVSYSDVQGGWPGKGNIDLDPCFVQTEYFGPIAYWKLDEAGGTTAYDSAGSNHGNVYEAMWTDGLIDGALSFDGLNDYVSIPENSELNNLSAITLEAWIYPERDSHWHIHDKGDGDKRIYAEGTSLSLDGRVRYTGNHAFARSVSNTVILNTWQHVALTWSLTDHTTRLYHNGVEVNYSIRSIGTGFVLDDTSHFWTIGTRGALGEVTFFDGLIDEAAIHDRVLSSEEIREHYLAGLSGQGYPGIIMPDYHLLEDSPCINTGDPDYVAEPNETDLDGKPRVIGGRIDMGAYEFNHKPIANAGPDQTVEAQAPWGATVTLDGSGSSDADSTPGTFDDINAFNWYEIAPCDPNADIFLGTGVIIDCNLATGEHIVLLEVIDRAGESDTNEVTIIVQDTTPPEFTNIPQDLIVECNGSGNVAELNVWLASAAAVDECGSVTITNDFAGLLNGCGATGSATVTWTAEDEYGNKATTPPATFTIADTTPPDINCPPDVTLEYPADTSSSATGKAAATDMCGDVTVRCRNRIIPGCGNTETIERTWIAADECGNESSCMQTIKVVDTTPPGFEFSVSPTMLWPPNHKMVEITPSWTVSDECDPSPEVSLVSIVANEGDDIIGDGHTSNDIQIDDDGSIFVRSERSGANTGRIYTITYHAVDDCGNTTIRSATVSIPHDFKVLAGIASRWLWSGPAGRIPEDLNGDGVVNLADFAKFAGNWTR